jgi:uncharacterized repeat protein (TIGR01451 family)
MSVRFWRIAVSICICFAALATAALASDTFPGTTLSGSSGTVTGTTVGMTGETGEPNFTGGTTSSDWYSWTAPSNGYFTIGTCNLTGETTTATDTTLAAYTGNAVNALTQVQVDDDSTGCNSTVNGNYGSTLAFTAVSGTTYRFQIDTYNNSTQNTYILRYGYAGLTVATTDSTTTEGTPVTDTGTFTVVPTSVIGVTGSASMVVTIGASSPASQCTFSPTTLTFTKANWTTPQTVTVSAVDDATVEGTHSCKPASIIADANYNNTAVASGSLPTITIFDNENPNFTISKAVSAGSISAPGTLNYTITVDNSGDALLTSPVITDTLKLNTTTLTPTSGPTLTGGDTNSDGQLQDTETWIYTVTYAVTQADIDTGGSITNVSTWACAQVSVKTSNTVTTTISQSPNYTIAKTQSSGPSPITAAGQVIGYSITVANTGNVTLTSPSLTSDTFQLGGVARTLTTAPALSSGDTNSNGKIDVGETWVYAANYTVPQTDIDGTGSYTNVAAYSTAQAGAKTSNTITTNVTRTASMSVVKAQSSGPSPITAAGQVIGYSLTVTNMGNQTLTTPTLTSDTFQLNGAARTLTSAMAFSSGDTNSNGKIDVGEAWVYAASYTVPQTDIDGTGSFTNVAVYTTAQVAATTSNTVTTAVTRTASLTLAKTQSSGPSPITAAGQAIGYSITVTNTGNQTLLAPVLTDTFKLAASARTLTSGPTLSGDTNSNGKIEPTETWVYAASYTVPQSDLDGSGSFTNVATLTTTQVASTTSNTVTTAVTRTASLTIAKTQSSGSSPVTAAGQSLGYTITVTNTGNQTLLAPALTDTFQLGGSARTLTSGPTLSGDTNANGKIEPTEVWTYAASYTVPQTDIDGTGSFTNAATITTTQVASTTSNTVTTAVTRTASLTIAKTQSSGSSPVTAAGQSLGYTITVTNTGNQTLLAPALTDTFQLGGSARTLTSGPTLSGDTNANGKIEPTEVWTYAASYTVPQTDIDGTGSFTNAATFTTTQVASTTSNTVTTAVTRSPSMTVVKTQSSGASPVTAAGQTIGYNITVTNTGNQTLTGLSISDTFKLGAASRTLTSGPTYSSGDTNSDGKINLTEAWVYTASYTVPQSDLDATGNFTNFATFTTTQVAATNSGTVTTNVTRSPSMTVVKALFSGPSPVTAAGQVLGYRVTITNTGNQTLTGLSISDNFQLGGSARTLTSGPSYLSGDTNSNSSIDVGEAWIYSASYTVPQSDIDGTGSYTNAATFTTAQVAATTSSTITTAITRSPSMTAVKAQSSGPSPVTAAAQVIGYTVTITNTGNQTLTGLSIADTFKLGAAARTLTSGPTYSSGDSNSNGKIDVGEAWVYAASYTVPQADIDATGSFTNFATYTTTQVAATNSNTITTNVTRSPAFTIAKARTTGPAPVTAAGQILGYGITIANTGNQTLTGLTITDALLLNAASRTLTSGPSYSSGDTNSNGNIDVGETWVYAATYTVTQTDVDTGGTFSNTATFNTTQVGPTTSSAVTTAITQTKTIGIVKSWAFAPGGDVNSNTIVDKGDTLKYTYTVTNTGNVTLTSVSVSDAHLGLGTPPVPAPASVASLSPGANTLFTSTYLVVQADIDHQ